MKNFTQLGIHDTILKALSALGFEEPTAVQEQVIPLMLEKQVDLVSLAQTGTGKTAAFGIPLLQRVSPAKRHTQGLVLCPTRELCIQVARDIESYAKYIEKIKVLAVYGGSRIDQQMNSLRKGVQIIVATPGRLKDLLSRKAVDLSRINYVVFDEADEMLQMGFQDDLTAILAYTPKKKNTLLFSATMPKEVASIARKYMVNPLELTIGTKNAGAENIRHEYYMVHARNRYLALKRIVDNSPSIYSIIFCRTRRETNEVANKLIQDGYNADALHGDLSQAQRDQVMGKFRCKNLQILVATDVAARGLDVHDLTHVINYNLPDEPAAYTHRSGRTGRAGRKGVSIVIITSKEQYKLRLIEKKLQKQFIQSKIPTGVEICNKQLVSLIDDVTNVTVNHDQIAPLYEKISEKLAHLDREELIKRFISLEFNRFLEYYKNAPDLNVSDRPEQRRGRREQRNRRDIRRDIHPKQKFTTFSLNVGRRQGIMPQGLIGKINEIPDVGRIKIGQIDILRNSATLEVDSRYTTQILGAFQHSEINGKTVSIEITKGVSGKKNRGKRKGSFHRKGRKPKTA
ncbi:MAG: DEAD/DEAH box helicase [Thermodesulfobacteriota bacterium]|nr:DEAD/DEAH box helicase [Thermodesulfobacteriota bacterium]